VAEPDLGIVRQGMHLQVPSIQTPPRGSFSVDRAASHRTHPSSSSQHEGASRAVTCPYLESPAWVFTVNYSFPSLRATSTAPDTLTRGNPLWRAAQRVASLRERKLELRRGETLIRAAKHVQRRMNDIASTYDVLRRFIGHCELFSSPPAKLTPLQMNSMRNT
jgi:hypothetical protein